MTFKLGFFLLGIILAFHTAAQNTEIINLGGTSFITLSDQLPDDLSSERSLAVITTPVMEKSGFMKRGDWKALAEESHKTLRKIGIDPIAYVYSDDLNAGPEVNNAYLNLFRKRKVKNLVLIRQEGELPDVQYHITITPFQNDQYIINGQPGWKTAHTELSRVLLRLGRQVLRQELERSNMLIPAVPEYLQDLKIFTGTRYENYPSRLRSLKLAVVAFQRVEANTIGSPDMEEKIAEYNAMIDTKNEQLAELMEAYPFKFDIVTETDEDALYQAGYQYALMPLSSTGRAIKKILNFSTTQSETHYMSSSFNEEGKTKLKKIPVDANVTKYYIKQTIVKDLHTGTKWDADTSWEKALENFIFNMNEVF